MTQLIRPSQFILTYGPGAILESPSGPVVVKDLTALCQIIQKRIGDVQMSWSDFELLDQRFTSQTLHPDLPDDHSNWKILRLPTNADLHWGDSRLVYPIERFPGWCLCAEHQILYRRGKSCDPCGLKDQKVKETRAGHEAFRFIRACPNGHLDDVPWHDFVHLALGNTEENPTLCHQPEIKLEGAGGGMETLKLVCTCGRKRKMLDLFHQPWKCSGKHAHRDMDNPEECNQRMWVHQRGAHALFQPEVVTSLTLEPVGIDIFRLAQELDEQFRISNDFTSKKINEIDADLASLWAERKIGDSEDEVEMKRSAYAARIMADPKSLLDLLRGLIGTEGFGNRARKEVEFERLESASLWGAPVEKNPNRNAPPLFEVPQEQVRELKWVGPTLQVAPVTRLRELAVQAGFRRMVGRADDKPQLVSAGCQIGDDPTLPFYFPGVERYGEGLFFTLAGKSADYFQCQEGPRWKAWFHRWEEAGRPSSSEPFGHPCHPQEVWWHTLSHRLLRAVSLHAGYTSTALRERIFFQSSADGGHRGGLLIYAVQAGGDGTLGGLTALTRHMEGILEDAIQDLAFCSNGPVCEDAAQDTGAACYACLYASETSCEFRNQGLDRLLLLETIND